MALRAESKLENVVASIAAYFSLNYTFTPIMYPLSRFAGVALTRAQTEWIQLDLIPGPGLYHRVVSAGLYGETRRHVLQVSCYGSSRVANRYRILEIRDAVLDVLEERTEIPFTDHTTGGASGGLGALFVEGPTMDFPVEEEADYDRLVVSTTLQVLQIW